MENIFVEFLPPWVETGLQPAFYDKESGSVLQQTARMYARVNMLIRMFNKLSKNTKETVEEYINKFNELHDYVQDYFENLDVQEEINNKLDAMAESGALAEVINEQLFSSLSDRIDNNAQSIDNLQGSVGSLQAKQADAQVAFSNINNTLVENAQSITNLQQGQANSVQKNEIDSVTLSMLTSEVRSAITGGSTPIVGVNSVGTAELKNNAVNIFKLDPTLQNLYSINYEQVAKPQANNGFYQIKDGTVKYFTNMDTTECYVINLEQGKTYRFSGFNYSAVNGLIIATDLNTVPIAYSENGTALNADGMAVLNNTYSTELLFQCTQSGLKAFITRFKDGNSVLYPNLQDKAGGLEEITSIEIFSNELPRTALADVSSYLTINNSIVQAVQTNNAYKVRDLNGYNIKCYRVQKGHKYVVSGTQQYNIAGFLMFDEQFKMIYRSATDTNPTITPYEYEFTAQGNYYVTIVTGSGLSASFKEYVISLDNNSKLKGKKIIYDGDSITESRLNESSVAYNGGAYPKIISDLTSSTYVNYAIGGATLASATGGHRVVDNITNMDADADVVIFSGGINDYWQNIPLGTYTEDDFTGTVDKTTVCGALESIFRQAINKWCGKPILFVITHKILNTAFNNNTQGYSFSDLHDAIVNICKKYSIPYYDCFKDGGLNAYIDIMNTTFLTAGTSGVPDGCHPNAQAYERYYVPQVISLINNNLKN